MRILMAVGVGMVTGVAFVIAYNWLFGWIMMRVYAGQSFGMTSVGGVPVSVAFIIGFGAGFLLMTRR